MQALGDMQGLKGNDRFDRFDTFIYELDRYFLGISHNVISASTSSNKSDLIAYLNNFESIMNIVRKYILFKIKNL